MSIHNTLSTILCHNLQAKNSSQFAAWSSSLHSHEMYRKALLASGSSGTEGLKEEGEVFPGADGIENWISRTQETISSIRKGESVDTVYV